MADAAGLHQEMFEAIESRDFERLRELYHPEYSYTGTDGVTVEGTEAALAIAEMYTAAFPDLRFAVRNRIYDEHTSVVEVTARGTHRGQLDDIAPTGKVIEMAACNVIEIRDGKIYREHDYWDTLAMLRQLGVA